MGSPRGRSRSNRVSPRKVRGCVFLRQHAGAAVQDAVDQPQHVRIVEFARQRATQDGVVDRREELLDVALQDVAVAAGERRAAVEGAVRALADAVGVAVGDEAALEDRLDEVAQRVVDDAVAERRGGNQAALGFVDVERDVRAGAVSVREQLFLKLEEVVFQAVLEGRHVRVAALAFGGAAIGEQQVVPGTECRCTEVFPPLNPPRWGGDAAPPPIFPPLGGIKGGILYTSAPRQGDGTRPGPGRGAFLYSPGLRKPSRTGRRLNRPGTGRAIFCLGQKGLPPSGISGRPRQPEGGVPDKKYGRRRPPPPPATRCSCCRCSGCSCCGRRSARSSHYC